MTPPISVLVPSYNEEETIVENVRALLTIDYPSYEIIVINDGSRDRTMKRLIEGFDLLPTDMIYRPILKTESVNGFFTNPDITNLIVVDKDNSGKADSLNVGINLAKNPYFCCIDADTVLENDALLRLMKHVIESRELIVACGGILRIANGCSFKQGRIQNIALPKDILSNLQIVEYLRAFLFGRASWSALNGLLIIAGAFSLFHKKSVQDVGGYSLNTLSEDMELVVRLHRYMREKGITYRIVFVSDPIGWTEVPTSIEMLAKQRMRWHMGLAESLFMNIRMLLNPGYGVIGLFSMPYQLFIELFGPLIEFIGYIIVIVSYLTGVIDSRFFMLFLSLAILYSIFLSAGAVLLEEITYRRYPRWTDLIRLLLISVAENFGYRQLVSWWRFKALIYRSFSKGKWQAIKKKGFKISRD
ncbi:MAG TPA: glycosyl transferase [Nitrospiraceae bacterium]|nr:glycosyl transferase [Nitrospiraceae bacterium]